MLFSESWPQWRIIRVLNAIVDGTQALDKLTITDGVSVPDTESGKAFIYVDSADGDLKVKFGDGTVKTITTDT